MILVNYINSLCFKQTNTDTTTSMGRITPSTPNPSNTPPHLKTSCAQSPQINMQISKRQQCEFSMHDKQTKQTQTIDFMLVACFHLMKTCWTGVDTTDNERTTTKHNDNYSRFPYAPLGFETAIMAANRTRHLATKSRTIPPCDSTLDFIIYLCYTCDQRTHERTQYIIVRKSRVALIVALYSDMN